MSFRVLKTKKIPKGDENFIVTVTRNAGRERNYSSLDALRSFSNTGNECRSLPHSTLHTRHVTSLVKFKSHTIHHLKEEFILCRWCHVIMYFMTQSTPLRVRLRRSYITIYELFIKGKHRMIRVERQKTKTNRTIKARSTMAAAILHSAACLSESL